MQINPYLSFDGRCEEAIEFYKIALGAQVTMMMRFNQAPESQAAMITPGSENKIMHATLRIGESTLMATDGQCLSQAPFHGISMSLTVATVAEGERLFAALGDGGKVCMPFTKTFFSPGFGMVNDPFGVPWMIMVAA